VASTTNGAWTLNRVTISEPDCAAPAVTPTSGRLRTAERGTPLRIAINCLQVDPAFVGGVTTYVLGLLGGFRSAGRGCRFRLFVSQDNQHLFASFQQCDNFEVVVLQDPLLALRTNVCRIALLSHSSNLYKTVADAAFKHFRELMESGSDVLYNPTPTLRCFNNRKPTVLTMHDIQHLHYPEFFGWAQLLSRRITYNLSARYANYFHASSEFIKQDLLAHFPWLTPEQVEVIPPGVPFETFAAPSAPHCLSRYRLPERFLFFPAQLWPHKNHLTVLKALKQIESQHQLRIPLVLTGAKFAAAPAIFDFVREQAMDYVSHLGKVSAEEMVALYQNAAFMITATLHEASSFPILESAAAGTPVIGSNIPPFQELGQLLQLNLFNPLDVEELADLIVRLWNDERTRAAQAAHNREAVKLFSWENTARGYVQLFERSVTV
jgi:glycosyltransferase involved in cell wall biosynthesis